MTASVRAGLLAAVYAVMLLVAPPGLDLLGARHLATEEARAKASAEYGVALTTIGYGFAEANRRIRRPMASWFLIPQRIFRIEQTWNFYGSGHDDMYALEVLIDDAPVYRGGDAALNWRAEVLETRRLRPIAQAVVVTRGSRNTEGFARLVLRLAREDFPEARSVKLRALKGDFPGENLIVTHTISASAPDWTLALPAGVTNP